VTILKIEDSVIESTDNFNVAAVAVPRPGTLGPVLLTASDISGSISLDVYLPGSSVPVYSTTFLKTLVQDGAPYAVIHAATVDSLWEDVDDLGHNFAHAIRASDLGAVTLNGGRRYAFVYRIPTTKNGTVVVIFEWTIVALH